MPGELPTIAQLECFIIYGRVGTLPGQPGGQHYPIGLQRPDQTPGDHPGRHIDPPFQAGQPADGGGETVPGPDHRLDRRAAENRLRHPGHRRNKAHGIERGDPPFSGRHPYEPAYRPFPAGSPFSAIQCTGSAHLPDPPCPDRGTAGCGVHLFCEGEPAPEGPARDFTIVHFCTDNLVYYAPLLKLEESRLTRERILSFPLVLYPTSYYMNEIYHRYFAGSPMEPLIYARLSTPYAMIHYCQENEVEHCCRTAAEDPGARKAGTSWRNPSKPEDS